MDYKEYLNQIIRFNGDKDLLIIMTDGYAPVPSVPAFLKTKLLWVIDNELSYKQHYNALRKTGRVCLIEL